MYMKFSISSFMFDDDEPGMSFGSSSDCPQASQTSGDRQCAMNKLAVIRRNSQARNSNCNFCNHFSYTKNPKRLSFESAVTI